MGYSVRTRQEVEARIAQASATLAGLAHKPNSHAHGKAQGIVDGLTWVLGPAVVEPEPDDSAKTPADDERATDLAPPRQAGKVGVQIAGSKRWLCIGKYDWLRADLWSALSWCLSKFYWDISGPDDQDRRLVLQDASAPAASVPEHPAPVHGSALRWLDVCYPTTGPSNWTQAGARDPGVPMVNIWDGDRPDRLDCRRLYLWWDLLARVFPGVSIETDARIVSAVRAWAVASGVKSARLEAVLSRVTGDGLATSIRYGHQGHAHYDFGDAVYWSACVSN